MYPLKSSTCNNQREEVPQSCCGAGPEFVFMLAELFAGVPPTYVKRYHDVLVQPAQVRHHSLLRTRAYRTVYLQELTVK